MVLGLKPMGKLATSRKVQVLDRTKVLHGPRTQTYGKTSYFKKKSKYQTELRSCTVLRLKPIGKLATSRKSKYQTKLRSCMVIGLKLMGKLATSRKSKYQTELRSCMVLRLKPMGKLVTSKKNLSARQNQGLAWSLNLLRCRN